MVQCTFCGSEMPKGTGVMFVKKNGKIIYFCSSKCEKNSLNLKRKGTKLKWTEHFRKQKTSKSNKVNKTKKIK